MKAINIASDIIPLGEFKARAAGIIKELATQGRPMVITQNGRPACVVMSPAEFDRMRERQAFLEAVAQGQADLEAGHFVSDAEMAKQLDENFGALENK